MLRPAKHSHPDQSIVYLSSVLARHLRRRRVESYSGLLDLARRSVGGAEDLFAPTLSLLFGLGLIEYRRKADSFEYVGAG